MNLSTCPQIRWEKNITLGEPPGFLHSWWCVFWDLYCAAPERRETCDHSSEAKAFHDYVSPDPAVHILTLGPNLVHFSGICQLRLWCKWDATTPPRWSNDARWSWWSARWTTWNGPAHDSPQRSWANGSRSNGTLWSNERTTPTWPHPAHGSWRSTTLATICSGKFYTICYSSTSG